MNRRSFFKAMAGVLAGAVVGAPRKVAAARPLVVEQTSPYQVVMKMEDGPGGSIHVHGPDREAVQVLWDELYKGWERGVNKLPNGAKAYYGVSRNALKWTP